MLIQFVVSGQPVGKGRPRFSKRGNYVHTYTPDKTKSYEGEVLMSYINVAGADKGFAAGIPVGMTVRLYYKIPKGVSKAKRQKMLNGEIRPLVKPDVDNVIKCLCDALNGIAWADDNQVANVWASKFYSDNPRAEISIFDL